MITTLDSWTEVIKGLFRYVLSANCCYEIHINYRDYSKDLFESNCNLYIVGDWRDSEHKRFLERELLLENKTLHECLLFAEKDDKENNS